MITGTSKSSDIYYGTVHQGQAGIYAIWVTSLNAAVSLLSFLIKKPYLNAIKCFFLFLHGLYESFYPHCITGFLNTVLGSTLNSLEEKCCLIGICYQSTAIVTCSSTILQLMHLNITIVDILHFSLLNWLNSSNRSIGGWLLEIGFRVSCFKVFIVQYCPMLNGVLVASILSSQHSQSCNIIHQIYL